VDERRLLMLAYRRMKVARILAPHRQAAIYRHGDMNVSRNESMAI